jgi:acetoin utilization protein AcuB
MLREIVTAPSGTTLSDAEGLVRSARLRHLVIVDNGIVVGLLSHREVLDLCLAKLREEVGADSANILASTTIEQLVREEPVTIAPAGLLETAASRMLAFGIGCLPVAIPTTRGPRLVGLVTEAGLLRAAYLPAPPGGSEQTASARGAL